MVAWVLLGGSGVERWLRCVAGTEHVIQGPLDTLSPPKAVRWDETETGLRRLAFAFDARGVA